MEFLLKVFEDGVRVWGRGGNLLQRVLSPSPDIIFLANKKKFKKQARKHSQPFIRWVIRSFVKVLRSICIIIPYNYANLCGKLIGRMVFLLLRKERDNIYTHLSYAYGNELSFDDRKKIAAGCFINQASNIFEFFTIGSLDDKKADRIFTVEGEEHLKKAVEIGRGAIIVTAHQGNWETMGMWLRFTGYRLSVIAAPIYDSWINSFMIKARLKHNIETIVRHDPHSSRKILRVLRKGECLGLFLDQDVKAEGTYVSFFGKEAFTVTGIIDLAVRKAIPIIPIFAVRNKDGTQKIVIEEAVIPDMNLQSELVAGIVKETVQKLTWRIENAVRRNPDQWVWMHRRWKTKRNENI